MRAWEFLREDRSPPSYPITIRALHKIKLEQKRHETEEKERHKLMRIMYSDPATEQEKYDLERQHLELEQLRAEILATEIETSSKSAMALHNNAKSGLKAERQNQQKLHKLAKSGLGRELKP